MSNRMKNKGLIIGALLVVIILVTGALFITKKNKSNVTVPNNQVDLQNNEANIPANQEDGIEELKVEKVDTSNWKTYRDEKYKFEIKYNPDWEIREEGTNAFGGEWVSIFVKESPKMAIQINRRVLEGTKNSEWIRNEINPLIGKGQKKEIIGDDLMNNSIYAWHVISSNNTKTYKTHEYFITDKKNIILFYFGERNESNDYHEYLLDFEAMVNSIKFID